MPLSFWAYLYIVLVAADVLCLIFAAMRKDLKMVMAFLFALPWLLISLSTNCNVCPMIYCAA